MNNFLSKRFLFALLAVYASSVAAAEVRLAVVPVDGRTAIAGELLTVEFSRAPYGVAILERTEIERVRREQKFTARSSDDFARLGRTLGAHGVLVIEMFEQKDATNLTLKLIAVQPGAALGFQSYPWPVKETEDWSALVGKQFAAVLPKLAVLAQDAIPISILNLRSPLQTSEGVRLESDATTLLINRLIAQKEIFVLERQRMALLGAEKELKEMQESAFWNGSHLLEGVVERGGVTRDVLTINARLVSPARTSQTVSVKSEAGKLNVLIDELARELISRLGKTTNFAPWNPAAEAKRYLEEARWGMRWGNVPLAQAAADSAWALGEHTLETARLRVNSYAAQSPPFNMPAGLLNGEYMGPAAAPPPGDFGKLLIAFEHFLTLTPALSTNAEAKEWTTVGLGLLGTAALRLSHYWYFPERTAAIAKDLERLRVNAREIERVLLKGNDRPDARTFASGIGTNLWQMRLDAGWVYAESPEAAVAEFRRLFDSGMTRVQREQFVGSTHRWMMPWTDSDRTRARTVWASFIEDLARSTNATLAVSACLMEVRVPLPPERAEARMELARRQQRLSEVMLKHRHALLCAEPDLMRPAMKQLDRVLVVQFGRRLPWADTVRTNFLDAILTGGECYDAAVLSWLFQPAAFETNHLNKLLTRIAQGHGTNSPASWRKRFFKAYLTAQPDFRPEVFAHLFRTEDYDAAEAKPLLNRLNDWRDLEKSNHPQNVAPLEKYIATLQAIITPPATTVSTAPVAPPFTPPPAGATVAIDPNVLAVTGFWRPQFKTVISQSTTQLVTGYSIVQTLAKDGFVWTHVRGRYEYRWPSENVGYFYISNRIFEQFHRIDATDLSSTVSPDLWPQIQTPFPQNVFGPYTALAAKDGVLYVHEAGKLFSWDGREPKWRTIDVVLPGQMTMQAVGERFYFGNTETLLEFNPTNLALRTMASRRRNPPIAAEDRLSSYGTPIFLKGASDTVLVTLGGTVHPWNVGTGAWSEPFSSGAAGMNRGRPTAEQDSVLYWTGQPHEDRELHRFTGPASDELLLEVKRPNNLPPGMSRSKAKVPLWKTPANIDHLHLATAHGGTNLWGFEWRQPSLTYFDQRWDEPFVLKLSLTPKALTNESPAGDQYIFTPTRDGLVVFRRYAEGVWLIPRRDTDPALAALMRSRGPERKAPPAFGRALISNSNDFAWADEAKSDAMKIIRTYESSKPGALNMGELVSAIKREPTLAPYRPLLKNFQASFLLIDPYDTNGNQRIDGRELDAMIKAGKPRVTREEFMSRWDFNKNDEFDIEEIRAANAEKTARWRRPSTNGTPVKPPATRIP